MKFILNENIKDCSYGLNEILKCIKLPNINISVTVYFELTSDNNVKISFKDNILKISASKKVHFYRAIINFIYKININYNDNFEYSEDVFLDNNGVMIDCSRNSVLKVSTIKKYIRLLASVGMNIVMLYTEDTYEVDGYEYFGAFRGRYSKKELKEIDKYALEFGIEVIPCIQTLAHLSNFIRWKQMDYLCDTEDILMVGDEKVYHFIDACIKSVSECFTSKKIHLGMDEAWSLGLGNYLYKNGYKEKSEIMTYHLNRVNELCIKYNLEPMIWSDMYFRMKSKENKYFDIPLNEDLYDIPKPPENMSLVYWDYYHIDSNFYSQYLRMHKQLCNKVWFASGGWTWNGISPNYTKAINTIKAGLDACKERNIRDVICTFWQDDGAETPMFTSVLPIIYSAESGYNKNVDIDKLKAKFLFVVGVEYDKFMLLDKLDNVPGTIEKSNVDNPSKYLLYQDLMLGLFDEQIRGLNLSKYYKRLKLEIKDCIDDSQNEYNLVINLYCILAELLEYKCELGIRIYDAYHKDDKNSLFNIADKDIDKCIELVVKLRELRENIWYNESKIQGFECIDMRMGALIQRLITARRRILLYLNNKIEKLYELEESRLKFQTDLNNSNHKTAHCNSWRQIVSISNEF